MTRTTWYRSLLLAGLAAALAGAVPAGGARAADVPGDASTRATLTVQSRSSTFGEHETATDSDWFRVRLVRGTDYAVRADTSIGAGLASSITARDPRGRPIRTVPGDGLSDVGFELRATVTGTHFVEVRALNPDEPLPLRYAVAVTPDCRDAASTKCRLEVGRAREGTSV